ncbi:MAG TPA: hypothetical protein VFE32_14605 [Puia sp.]|jgi:hypothetical protein|nr:hypothetical protein [Puia sp.]
MGYAKRLAVCLLTGLTAALTAQRVIYRIFWEFRNKYTPPPVYAISGLVMVVLLVVIYSMVWRRNEKKGVDSQRIMVRWQGVLAGFIAFDLSMFGWQKLFHLQFFTPLGRLDEPFNSFPGEALTWAYFGHSYPFTCVVGLFQILGAFLLLFRRTRLFGAILLFPVLLNIVLLNVFYDFPAGDLVHALILVIALLYLILQDYRRLAAFFFPPSGRSKGYSGAVPAAAVIVVPLLLVLSFGPRNQNPQLTGKYRVQDLSINQVRAAVPSCGDSVLSTVYFDQENEMVLEFNSMQRRWIGRYRLDRATGDLVASWRYPISAKDTLMARLDRVQPGEWRLTGLLGKDSLRATLVKE